LVLSFGKYVARAQVDAKFFSASPSPFKKVRHAATPLHVERGISVFNFNTVGGVRL
jgi:hypothetical protein